MSTGFEQYGQCSGLRAPALDRVELGPEHLGLEPERRHGALLLLARRAALDDEVERVLRIARRLHQAAAEVLEPGRIDPRVVRLERREPDADRVGAEELGERRRDPLDPRPSDLDLRAVGEDRRVLDRDAALVVEAVGDPALKLLACQLAGVHPHVEAVEVVVPRPLRSQALDELVRRPRLRRARTIPGGDPHSSSSRPSYATSAPARRTASRSGESSRSTGLVLLMCTRIFRGRFRTASASSVPPGPESGTWPICRAVRSEKPRSTSSSSLQNVPSTSTASLHSSRSSTSSLSSASPGT